MGIWMDRADASEYQNLRICEDKTVCGSLLLGRSPRNEGTLQ